GFIRGFAAAAGGDRGFRGDRAAADRSSAQERRGGDRLREFHSSGDGGAAVLIRLAGADGDGEREQSSVPRGDGDAEGKAAADRVSSGDAAEPDRYPEPGDAGAGGG